MRRATSTRVKSFPRYLVPALFGALLSQPAAAQVNVEPIRQELEASGQKLSARFGMIGRRGNTDGLSLDGGSLIGVSGARHLAYLTASGSYAEYDGTRQVAKSFAHLRYNYGLLPRVAAEVFAQVETDEFRRLVARELFGVGPRFTLLGNAVVRLYYGSSAMLELTQRNDTVPAAARDVESLRWNNYASLTVRVQDRITLSETVYYQPRFGDFGDFWFLNVTGAHFVVTDVLSSRVDFTLRREAVVPAGVRPADAELSSSLEFSF